MLSYEDCPPTIIGGAIINLHTVFTCILQVKFFANSCFFEISLK